MFMLLLICLFASSSCPRGVGAITNNNNRNGSEQNGNITADVEDNRPSSTNLDDSVTRRNFVIYTDQSGKPIRFEDDAVKLRYEDYTKQRIRQNLKGEKDALTSSSGNYDSTFGIYGPPDDQDFNYQGYQSPTYVSTVPFSSQSDHGFGFQHSYATQELAPHQPPHPHPPPPNHALALKGLFLPLAGVALLGAAAALVSNPVLLQLGVITGRRRRRRRSPESDPFANNKYAKIQNPKRVKQYNMK